MPTIADLRAKYPDLAGLDDEQTVDAVHQAFYADLPREQVAASLGVKPPPAPKATRTMGEAISDTGRGIMSGAAGLVKTGGELYGLATGDMENAATELGTNAQEYWENGQSKALKEKRADRKAAIDASTSTLGKFGTAIYETLKDPALLGDVVASNVATMVPGMAFGRLASAGRMTMAMRAAQGAGPVSMAEQAAIAKGAGTLGTAAAVGAAAVQQGADVSGDTYDDTLRKTAEQLAANPDFVSGVQAKVQAGMDEPSAILATKKELGNTAARAAFVPATAISLAANAIPGSTMLERALVGGAAKNTIKAGGGKFAAMAKAGIGEAAQETLEEGGGAFAGNVAKQRYVDPNQDLSDSVGENAGLGFVGGLGMGVPGGALHGHAAPGDEIRAQKLDEVGPLTRGVNAGLEDTAQRVDSGALPIVSADQLVTHAQQRLAELDKKAKGTKDEKVDVPDGEPIVTPGTPGQFLTADEIEERKQLSSLKDDPKGLARAMGVELGTPSQIPVPAAPAAAPAEEAAAAPTPAPAPAPVAKPAPSREAAVQREADRPAEVQGDIQPGDRLNKRGGPFLSMPGAMSELGRAGEDTHEIVKVTGGLVVRPKAPAPGSVSRETDPVSRAKPVQATTAAQPTTLGDAITAQPAGTRGTTAADLTIDAAAHEAAPSPKNDRPEPTQAQKEAGNYKLGHDTIGGLDLSFENPAGSVRKGVDRDGKAWENTLQHHYGYIKGTIGNDKDHVDAFVKPSTPRDYAGPVFVVDQIHPDTKKFDEHKVLIGFDTIDEAKAAYRANYAKDWKGMQAISAMPFNDFKAWVKDGPKNAPLVPITARPETGAADAERKVVGFKTAKGSTYAVEGERTTRNKAARDDAGHEGDSGPKATSARTVYIDGDASRVSAAGLSNLGERGSRVAIKDGKATLLTWNDAAGKWGAALSARDVPIHDEPAVGRSPLELWKPQTDVPGHEAYSNMHAGNPITEITHSDEPNRQAGANTEATAPEARADQAGVAPAVAGEGAGVPAARPAAVQAAGLTEKQSKAEAPAPEPAKGIESDRANPAEGSVASAPTAASAAPTPAHPNAVTKARTKKAEAAAPAENHVGANEAARAAEIADAAHARAASKTTPASEPTAPEANSPNAATKARAKKADIVAAETEAKRAIYFTPGNIVKSYGGFDEVLRYDPPNENQQWSVRVHKVEKRDGVWERIGKPQDARNHSTQPDPRELAKGPVAQVAPQTAAAVPHTELRADGKEFPNAEARASEPTPAELAATPEPAKIEDAGEKIGGARKDRWKERGLNLSDLSDMTDAQAAELVTKANVWKPDWKAIVDGGMSAPLAAHAKVVYDRLAAQPKDNTPEGRRRYVSMMQAVRKIYSALTPENVAGARNRLLYEELKWGSKDVPATAEHMAEAKKTLFSVYKGRAEPFSFDYNDMAKVKAMLAQGFPEKAAPWTLRYVVRQQSGDRLTAAGLLSVREAGLKAGFDMTAEEIREGYAEVRNTRGTTVAIAPNKEAAEERARLLYEQSLVTDEAGEQPERPHLDKIMRRGLAQHADRDVTSDDFLKDFGFRGVEFGNWAAQDERQRILNMAYDGLNDLADLLRIPPQALSLNGTLGMAFGARGGGRFAAHYEPGKLVINMTKLQGGGSLAHEWAHALDHYFGELDRGDAYKTKARGASGWYEQRNYSGKPQRRMVQVDGKWVPRDVLALENLRPELARAFDNVMQALYEGRIDKPAMLADLNQQLERTKKIATKEADPELKAMYERSALNQQQNIDEVKAEPDDTTYPRGKSQYAAEAQKLSGKSSEGYWLRPTEMFARAFESYIFDRIAAQNARSDYLVHGVEGERFADGDRYKGNPYPSGTERAAINKAFDGLVSELKTRETDAGGVALASRAAPSSERAALRALAETDELFALPKSRAETVEDIAADNDPAIKVSAYPDPGLSRYLLTMPDGTIATIFVREPSPYGPHSFGSTFNDDNELVAAQTVRPGDNPEAIAPDVEDVWVDASKLKGAGYGAKLYNIAQTFAHNTGRIFIGDPAGLSNDAMMRRPEQMLSSALKFGTTEHLAPHPRQIEGDAKNGVPALRWKYGDHEGNIRRLIDLNLAVQQNAGNTAITFDPTDGQFHDSAGQVIDRAGIDLLAEADLLGSRNAAGGRTTARAAVLRALLREESGGAQGVDGERGGLLARLAGSVRGSPAGTRGIFYSRTVASPQGGLTAAALRAAIAPITAKWKNGPKGGVTVVESADNLPESVLRSVRSSDPGGEARAWFDPATESAYLIADKLPTAADAQFALFHEVYGHFGMRSVLGDSYEAQLIMLRRANPSLAAEASMWFAQYGRPEVAARVKAGMDPLAAEREVRLLSTEEALADRAGADQPLKGWEKVSAKIQQFLRGIGLDAVADWLETRTEAETIAFLAQARDAVRKGTPSAARAAAPVAAVASRELTLNTLQRVADTKLPAGYLVGDFLNSDGKIGWWHKTVGSMHNLAERSPVFKRVYDAVQNFINDVSLYATEAADLAPRILPKLESWKDIGKSPLSAADTKAIAAPIFEGTLSWGRDEMGRPVKMEELRSRADALDSDAKAKLMMRTGKLAPMVLRMWQGLPIEQFEAIVDSKFEREMLKPGVVWKDAELKSLFNLTDAQIPLYREFRAATDRSLTNLALTEMIQLAGADAAGLRAEVLATNDVDKAGVLLRDHLFQRADSDPARKSTLNDTGNRMIDIADRAKDLMTRGYAPLSRFGEYTLDVVVDGERKFFSLYESKAERAKMARTMRAEFPTAQIDQGTISQEGFKLFAGVSPETMELFGEMLGLDAGGTDASSEAFAKFVKLTKSNRSTMQRLVQRKGIAGFSEDAGRVLAGFVYSNARKTSSNLHMKEIDAAVNDVPQGQGEMKDAASRLADYVKNPREEAQAFRGLLFAQYLGGSVASAMVNMTQPLAVTFPYLSQYGGVGKAAARMTAAGKDALKKTTGDANLDAALKHAEEQGIVAPQEVHQLMAQAGGRATLKAGDGTAAGNATAKASNALSKLSLAWGKVFGVAEQFNRRITFIAAYRTAIGEGIDNAAEFAAKAVAETQFTYNKGNKPRWARGAIGGTLFTFKSYSVQYLELLHRMATQGGPEGKKAALLALAVLFLMSGASGIPFADDMDDLIDGLMQRLGYNFSSKREKKEFFAKLLGEEGGRFIEHGLSGLPGVPIDVSGRMGMGNLIPGTGLLTKKADHTSDMTELLGPAGDLAKRAFDAVGQVVDGDVKKAVTTIAPTAARNVVKAVDMAQTGAYRDTKGRKVIDVDAGDVVSKALGFQPNDVARVQEGSRLAQDLVGQVRMKQTELNAAMAQAIYDKDDDARDAVRAARDRWNEKNPESRVTISMPSVLKQLQAMKQDKATRLANAAPKGIRQQVKRELAGATE